MELKERFLKYVGFDTQSDENSVTFPSTDKQLLLLTALKEEMEAMGMTEVSMDEHGYVMGSIEASEGYEHGPTIGFLAHVDTSPDMSGAAIKPVNALPDIKLQNNTFFGKAGKIAVDSA